MDMCKRDKVESTLSHCHSLLEEQMGTSFHIPEIRKLIYTTNSVETLHREFHKVTKAKTIFPTDAALKKMLYLAYLDISKKWEKAITDWNCPVAYPLQRKIKLGVLMRKVSTQKMKQFLRIHLPYFSKTIFPTALYLPDLTS